MKSISVYIHIPFCKSICSYCDFSKFYKNNKWISGYLKALKKEIEARYNYEPVKTLYIGGGTPSCLDIKQLKELFDILSKFNLEEDSEITFEANSEDLTLEKLKFLKNKINRLSIGVQSFNENILKVLNRTINVENIINAKKYFENINIDLMYGFNEENDLMNDLKRVIDLDVSHISVYDLIIEPHTKLFIEKYEKKYLFDYEKVINKFLEENGYVHYEISNYAKRDYQSKHNLTYWDNDEYYGFGLSSAGYVGGIRYENTRSLNKYLDGDYVYESHKLEFNEILQNEFILGFRKINGINKVKFRGKYGFDVTSVEVVRELLRREELIQNKESIYINPKYIYYSNEILLKFMESDLHEQEFVV